MQFITTDNSGEFHGIKVLVYGRSGVGKTQLSTTLPANETLYIAAEPGTLTLRNFPPMKGVRITTAIELQETINWMYQSGSLAGFRNIYFDSITEIAEIVLANAKMTSADGRKAYGILIDSMIPYIKAFRDIPLNVVMVAKQSRVVDEVSKMILFGPDMPGQQLSKELPYLFDEVLRLGIGKMPNGEEYRFLQCQPDMQYEAKDRSGALLAAEPPDLGLLFSKILARKQP